MSIFSTILAKIFPSSHPAVFAAPAPAQAPTTAASTSAPALPSQAASSQPPVDVNAVISAMPGASALNWKTSIVDLLKVLAMESSLDARKQLAHELGYAGSTEDTAAMNVWLHQQVAAKLAANGGKLPEGMKA